MGDEGDRRPHRRARDPAQRGDRGHHPRLADARARGRPRSSRSRSPSRSSSRSGCAASCPRSRACPGCGRTTSTFFQEMARDITEHLKARMPEWREAHPGVEELKVAVMGCVVNGPGESKHADIGISLPGHVRGAGRAGLRRRQAARHVPRRRHRGAVHRAPRRVRRAAVRRAGHRRRGPRRSLTGPTGPTGPCGGSHRGDPPGPVDAGSSLGRARYTPGNTTAPLHDVAEATFFFRSGGRGRSRTATTNREVRA